MPKITLMHVIMNLLQMVHRRSQRQDLTILIPFQGKAILMLLILPSSQPRAVENQPKVPLVSQKLVRPRMGPTKLLPTSNKSLRTENLF
jgi:hypothetical protein